VRAPVGALRGPFCALAGFFFEGFLLAGFFFKGFLLAGFFFKGFFLAGFFVAGFLVDRFFTLACYASEHSRQRANSPRFHDSAEQPRVAAID
jgi:hypothetical protein